MQGRIKRVFPGGNTSEGFFSYYSYLLEKGTRRTFVIKGGPGVGKSTLMKKIGHKMVDLGYDVEFHHCSSDNHSLDGIAVLDAGIVMVDGTAPHIVDPKFPGGRDEIINMGEFWDVTAMEHNSAKIIDCTQEVSRHFARAYRFLSAARDISEDIADMHRRCLDLAAVNQITMSLEEKVLVSSPGLEGRGLGKGRHLFSSAFTPEGFIDFTDSILQDTPTVYYIGGGLGTGKSSLLRKLADRAMEKGFEAEIYHTPLIPQKIGTVLFKELNIALTTSGYYQGKHTSAVNLNNCLDKGMLSRLAEDIENDRLLMEDLIAGGLAQIARAKAEHDILEQYYVPHMNFAAANEGNEKTLNRILRLADSST